MAFFELVSLSILAFVAAVPQDFSKQGGETSSLIDSKVHRLYLEKGFSQTLDTLHQEPAGPSRLMHYAALLHIIHLSKRTEPILTFAQAVKENCNPEDKLEFTDLERTLCKKLKLLLKDVLPIRQWNKLFAEVQSTKIIDFSSQFNSSLASLIHNRYHENGFDNTLNSIPKILEAGPPRLLAYVALLDKAKESSETTEQIFKLGQAVRNNCHPENNLEISASERRLCIDLKARFQYILPFQRFVLLFSKNVFLFNVGTSQYLQSDLTLYPKAYPWIVETNGYETEYYFRTSDKEDSYLNFNYSDSLWISFKNTKWEIIKVGLHFIIVGKEENQMLCASRNSNANCFWTIEGRGVYY